MLLLNLDDIVIISPIGRLLHLSANSWSGHHKAAKATAMVRLRSLGMTTPALMLALSGCIASTALDVVTAPVKVVGKAADWATTSQDESDRNRGRAMREHERRLGELDRRRNRLAEGCAEGDRSDCRDLEAVEAELAAERAKVI